MSYGSLADLPAAMRSQLDDLRNQWEALTGFRATVQDWQLVEMANSAAYQSGPASPIQVSIGHTIATLFDFGQYMKAHVNPTGDAYGALTIGQDVYQNMPWAFYGLKPEEYASQATTFATEYKKVTGQDISASALGSAFDSMKDSTGGLLTGSEYAQRLMQDQNIQKTYGWVKYGYDYNQFQQQKIQMRSLFGRDLSDQEATTQLQYLHAAQGGNHEVTAQTQQSQGQRKQAEQGVSGSVIR